MAKPWKDVAASPQFQQLAPEQQEEARAQYFNEVVAPNVPKQEIGNVRAQFDAFSVGTSPDASREAEVKAYDESGGGMLQSLKRGGLRMLQTGQAVVADTNKAFGLDRINKRMADQGLPSITQPQGSLQQNIRDTDKDIQAIPQHPTTRRMTAAANKADGVGSAVAEAGREFWQSPDKLGFVADSLAEQVPNFIGMAGGVKLAKDAIGTATKARQVAVLATGGAAGSVASTYGPNVAEGMRQGLAFDDAESRALKMSAAQAIVDGVTTGLVRFKIGPNQYTNVPAQALLQAAGGYGGAIASRAAVGEKASQGDAVMEGLMELLGLPVDMAMAAATKASTKDGAAPLTPNVNGSTPQQPNDAPLSASDVIGAEVEEEAQAQPQAQPLQAVATPQAAVEPEQPPQAAEQAMQPPAPTMAQAGTMQPAEAQMPEIVEQAPQAKASAPEIALNRPDSPEAAYEQTPTHAMPNGQSMDGAAHVNASQETAKEPWQMTAREWGDEREAVRPNTAQSSYTSGSKARAVSNIERLESLFYGVNDDVRSKLSSAAKGELALTREETDDLMDTLNEPVNHRRVIEKAISEGKAIPPNILAEYPDLTTATKQPASQPPTLIQQAATSQPNKERYMSYLRGRLGKTKFGEQSKDINEAWANRSAKAPGHIADAGNMVDKPIAGAAIQQPVQSATDGPTRQASAKQAQQAGSLIQPDNGALKQFSEKVEADLKNGVTKAATMNDFSLPDLGQHLQQRGWVEEEHDGDGIKFTLPGIGSISAAWPDASAKAPNAKWVPDRQPQAKPVADKALIDDAIPESEIVTKHVRTRPFKKPILDPAKDSLIVAIAKLGGLDAREAEAQGMDKADWRNANSGVWGMPWVRRTNGLTFDSMAEALSQYGYFRDGEYSPNALLDLISEERGGNKVYTASGYENAAERAYAARMSEEDYRGIAWLDDEASHEPELRDSLMAIDSLPPNSEIYTDDDIEAIFQHEEALEQERDSRLAESHAITKEGEGAKDGSKTHQSEGGKDLLGQDTRQAQAVADTARAKDAKRNGTKDVPVNSGEFFGQGGKLEPDLFERSGATKAEPGLQPGHVRVYHSGSKGEGEEGSGRWASTSRKYASSYRPNLPLFYFDLPADDPRVNDPDYPDEQGVINGFTFNLQLTPRESVELNEIDREIPRAIIKPVADPSTEQAIPDAIAKIAEDVAIISSKVDALGKESATSLTKPKTKEIEAKPESTARPSIESIPPARLKKIKVSVDALMGDKVQKMDVPATQAWADINEEINAYKLLLNCVKV